MEYISLIICQESVCLCVRYAEEERLLIGAELVHSWYLKLEIWCTLSILYFVVVSVVCRVNSTCRVDSCDISRVGDIPRGVSHALSTIDPEGVGTELIQWRWLSPGYLISALGSFFMVGRTDKQNRAWAQNCCQNIGSNSEMFHQLYGVTNHKADFTEGTFSL